MSTFSECWQCVDSLDAALSPFFRWRSQVFGDRKFPKVMISIEILLPLPLPFVFPFDVWRSRLRSRLRSAFTFGVWRSRLRSRLRLRSVRIYVRVRVSVERSTQLKFSSRSVIFDRQKLVTATEKTRSKLCKKTRHIVSFRKKFVCYE